MQTKTRGNSATVLWSPNRHGQLQSRTIDLKRKRDIKIIILLCVRCTSAPASRVHIFCQATACLLLPGSTTAWAAQLFG